MKTLVNDREHSHGEVKCTLSFAGLGPVVQTLTLPQIRDRIVRGDADLIDMLLHTIDRTIGAKKKSLHIESVRELNRKCVILNAMLERDEFMGKNEINAAFSRLSKYSDGLSSLLH